MSGPSKNLMNRIFLSNNKSIFFLLYNSSLIDLPKNSFEITWLLVIKHLKVLLGKAFIKKPVPFPSPFSDSLLIIKVILHIDLNTLTDKSIGIFLLVIP